MWRVVRVGALGLAFGAWGCDGRGVGAAHGADTGAADPGARGAEGAAEVDRAPPPETGPPDAAVAETGETAPDLPTETPLPLAAVRLAAWNLHNYSEYGTGDYRTQNLATKILGLEADAIGLEEIKVAEGTEGAGPQAWDALLAELPGYEGAHVDYNPQDTVVGLIWRSETTSVLAWKPIFEFEWWPFPRAPLEASLHILRDGTEAELSFIVVHLKAFEDGLERRREACQKLAAYMASQPTRRFVVMGDMNDSPYDPAEENAFLGTLQGATPAFRFVSEVLPPETVTSLGWYHYVDGQKIDGEFLDHAVVNAATWDTWTTVAPSVLALPWYEFEAYEKGWSDHFPIVLQLDP